jgi:hypothetical protein
MRKIYLITILFLFSCEREELNTKIYELSPYGEPSLLKVLSDPASSVMPLPEDVFLMKVEFSKPVDPSSLPGNILIHPVIGDVKNGENQIGEGVPVKHWELGNDLKTLLLYLSLSEGQYLLHLKKEIRSIDGKELDGICDFKDEPSDAFSSGFTIGEGERFVTRAFCSSNPFLSYLGPVGGEMEFKDHSGCSGKVNLEFPYQIDFVLKFSFPTGKETNYFLSRDIGKNIEMIDLTTEERIPLYFSLDNRVTWKDSMEGFEKEKIEDEFPIYIRPLTLSPLHRYVIRINRFETLKDAYGLPFSDNDPDEDEVYEVCFTTYGTSNTLRVKGIEIKKRDGFVSEIRITFLTPDPRSDLMDAETIVTENFSIIKAGYEIVPFELEVHREPVSMQEEDVVILKIPEGYLIEGEPFALTISYKVSDERGNTLDGNEDGYVEENGNDNYIRIFQ